MNEAERRLGHLLEAAGFAEGVRGEQIDLGPGLGTTTPDVIYRGHGGMPDVCVYLDGLSDPLHGNPRTAEQDREIRYWLRQKGHEAVEIAVTDLNDAGAMARHFERLARYLGAEDVRASVNAGSAWFEAATPRAPVDAAAPPGDVRPAQDGVVRFVEPTPETRYRSCVPLLEDLEAAAGDFGDPHGALGEVADSGTRWIDVAPGRRLTPDMFATRVVGRSMAPRIPDGSVCLFRKGVAGSRTGRIVLVRLRDGADPGTGERFTVKRYRSEKRSSADGPWRHVRITLEPLNPEFAPVELVAEDDQGSGAVDILAEFVEVLHAGARRESNPA